MHFAVCVCVFAFQRIGFIEAFAVVSQGWKVFANWNVWGQWKRTRWRMPRMHSTGGHNIVNIIFFRLIYARARQMNWPGNLAKLSVQFRLARNLRRRYPIICEGGIGARYGIYSSRNKRWFPTRRSAWGYRVWMSWEWANKLYAKLCTAIGESTLPPILLLGTGYTAVNFISQRRAEKSFSFLPTRNGNVKYKSSKNVAVIRFLITFAQAQRRFPLPLSFASTRLHRSRTEHPRAHIKRIPRRSLVRSFVAAHWAAANFLCDLFSVFKME